jgi:hypothetical protein
MLWPPACAGPARYWLSTRERRPTGPWLQKMASFIDSRGLLWCGLLFLHEMNAVLGADLDDSRHVGLTGFCKFFGAPCKEFLES